MAQLGPENVTAGTEYYYASGYDPFASSWEWQVDNGTVVNEGANLGLGIRFAYVVWGCPGAGQVRFVEWSETNGQSSNTQNVNISCPAISAPATSFTYTYQCGSTVITRTTNPPPGFTWFWQYNATDTSTDFPANTFTASNPFAFYLRARTDNSSCCWGPATATAQVTIISPSNPTVSGTARCGTGSVTVTASPVNGDRIRWYDATNTVFLEEASVSPFALTRSVSGTTTYHARTYSTTANCESSPVAVTATIHPLPSPPTSSTASPSTSCGSVVSVLSATGAGGGQSYAWYATPTGGSAISNSQTVSSTTTFYAAMVNNSSGCPSATRTAVTVTVNPVPLQQTVNGSGTYCASGAGLPVTLSNSTQPSVNYQLLRDGNPVGSAVAGNSGTFNFPNQAPGSTSVYTVRATNANGTCPTLMTGSATIGSSPVSLGGNVVGAVEAYGSASGSLTLSGHTGNVLRWERNNGSGWVSELNTSTTLNYNISSTQQYRAVVQSGVCPAVNSTGASVTIYPVATINFGGSPILAYGATVAASTGSYASYQWTKNNVAIAGATAATYIIAEPGQYRVIVKGSLTAAPFTSAPSAATNALLSQAQPVNWTSTTRVLRQGLNETSSLYTLVPEEVSQQIAYQDGLGRTFQNVNVGGAPQRGDIIAPVQYGWPYRQHPLALCHR